MAPPNSLHFCLSITASTNPLKWNWTMASSLMSKSEELEFGCDSVEWYHTPCWCIHPISRWASFGFNLVLLIPVVNHFIFSSVQFSRLVMSNSLQPYELQHTRPPCPSPTPNPCPLSQWCHPAISSSVVPFSSCPQSFPASGSFPMSQLFTWGGQSIGVSASASVLPMNTRTDLL